MRTELSRLNCSNCSVNKHCYLSNQRPTCYNILGKAPDVGISLHRRPFTCEGNLESGVGARILVTLNDE